MRVSAFLFVLVLLAGSAGAADGEGWSYELWDDLMSPFCPGRTLADCPSGQAEELRSWIVAQEEGGRDVEDVRAELYENFGEVLRQAPAPRGVGLVAYAIPLVAFLVGGGLVAVFLRRQSRGATAPSSPGRVAAVDPELARELEEEIGRP